MTEKEFDLLYAVHKNNSISNFDMETISHCQDAGLLKDGKVTDKGYEALKPYKVDNAIIMAAGRSRRCMPLSNYLPKGLFEIKGDTMVERQIKQLKDVGINEIILVVGYKKEKYYEMAIAMLNSGSQYWCLLCRERYDFTVFNIIAAKNYEPIRKELSETLNNRGFILDITKDNDSGAWEIWVKDFDTGEAFVYYLFKYDMGVIEINE